jgi:hypothetical protein
LIKTRTIITALHYNVVFRFQKKRWKMKYKTFFLVTVTATLLFSSACSPGPAPVEEEGVDVILGSPEVAFTDPPKPTNTITPPTSIPEPQQVPVEALPEDGSVRIVSEEFYRQILVFTSLATETTKGLEEVYFSGVGGGVSMYQIPRDTKFPVIGWEEDERSLGFINFPSDQDVSITLYTPNGVFAGSETFNPKHYKGIDYVESPTETYIIPYNGNDFLRGELIADANFASIQLMNAIYPAGLFVGDWKVEAVSEGVSAELTFDVFAKLDGGLHILPGLLFEPIENLSTEPDDYMDSHYKPTHWNIFEGLHFSPGDDVIITGINLDSKIFGSFADLTIQICYAGSQSLGEFWGGFPDNCSTIAQKNVNTDEKGELWLIFQPSESDPSGAYYVLAEHPQNGVFGQSAPPYFILDSITPAQDNISISSPTANPQANADCPGAPRSRIEVGERYQVCTEEDRLNLREKPGSQASSLDKLETGTLVKVIGGPVCENNVLWWQVEPDFGWTAGWVVEGSVEDTDPYFLCPQ